MNGQKVTPYITELYAENVKRLRVVRIVPDAGGGLVEISGANGSGKSSVLDAIGWALTGTRSVDPEPIRDGESSAVIRLTLGEVVVTRKFTESGSTLTIESGEGARFPSPQRMLDDLLGSAVLAFDPLAFDRMSPADQLAEVGKVAPLPDDVASWKAEARAAYDERTAVNRRAKELAAKLEGTAPAQAAEYDGPSVDQLLADLAIAQRQNAERGERARNVSRAQDEVRAMRGRVAALRAEADALERDADFKDEGILNMPAIGPVVDTEAILEAVDRARMAEAMNADRLKRAELEADLLAAERTADALTELIHDRQRLIEAATAAAVMPVDGLRYGEDGLEFNGHPLRQASGAERLRVALGLAMAAAPAIRVVRIKDGSLLDANSLAIVADMAAARGYQVWIERVDTTGRVGVVMSDGEVAAVNTPTQKGTE